MSWNEANKRGNTFIRTKKPDRDYPGPDSGVSQMHKIIHKIFHLLQAGPTIPHITFSHP